MDHKTATKIIVALAIAMAGCATHNPSATPPPVPTDAELLARHVDCPDGTPANLAPPAGTTLLFALDTVRGEQLYSCAAGAWQFDEPRADLFLLPPWAHVMVHHAGGPSWQFLVDSSLVVASKVAEAPSSTPGSIPQLLLEVTQHGGAGGFMTPVTHIQRLSTVGGAAPDPALCTKDTGGKLAPVPYGARYFFYGRAAPAIQAPQRCGA